MSFKTDDDTMENSLISWPAFYICQYQFLPGNYVDCYEYLLTYAF
jgi:hypothetical protein